jgi:predicted alpha/beta hydrolase family esterase
MTNILLVPGLWNSGPEHWQSYWERERTDCRRVLQKEWETPRCSDWVAALDAAVAGSSLPVVLAAHSLGCALVAHWAGGSSHLAKVRGALLVAPSDVEAPSYPAGTTGFAPMPLKKLPFRSIVVMSSDDQYVTPDRARRFARAWGSRLVDVGPKGHINSASGLGMWPEGFALVEELASPGR